MRRRERHRSSCLTRIRSSRERIYGQGEGSSTGHCRGRREPRSPHLTRGSCPRRPGTPVKNSQDRRSNSAAGLCDGQRFVPSPDITCALRQVKNMAPPETLQEPPDFSLILGGPLYPPQLFFYFGCRWQPCRWLKLTFWVV